MKRTATKAAVALGAMFALGACEPAPPSDSPSGSVEDATKGAAVSDVSLGARGEDVKEINTYLTQFGYFPNDELARKFPSWRPVAASPVEPAVFDERSAQAIRALQKNFGLPSTGIVDAATRSAMAQPRCGVPDNITKLDPSDKFAFFGSSWPVNRRITWRLTNSNLSIPTPQDRAAIGNAFGKWASDGSISFQELTTGTADIMITFAPIDGGGTPKGNTLAFAAEPASGGDVTIDLSEPWSVATPTPANSQDFMSTVVHELGHSLGLQHSSSPGSVMFPFTSRGVMNRSPLLDDAVADSALYDTLKQLPGAAKDIAAGADGSVWIVGTRPFGDGYQVLKWNGTGWDSSDGGAVRVAVSPSGIPWVVTAAGSIFQHTTNSALTGTWTRMPGLARDIGIGFDGSVWIIGAGSGDTRVFKWNGSAWVGTNGFANRIAVSPQGIPWVVLTNGAVFRRNTADPAGGSWELLPGPPNFVPQDIGVGEGTFPWVTATNSFGAGFQNFNSVWDEQPQIDGAPAARTWASGQFLSSADTNGVASISVGPRATPFIVTANGAIFTTFH